MSEELRTTTRYLSCSRRARRKQAFVKMLPPFSATLSPAFSRYLCSRSSRVSTEFSTEYTASMVLWYYGRNTTKEWGRGKEEKHRESNELHILLFKTINAFASSFLWKALIKPSVGLKPLYNNFLPHLPPTSSNIKKG